MNRRTAFVDVSSKSSEPNQIGLYMHCSRCIDENPGDVTPRDYAQLEVGLHPDGITVQVWCKRHEINVAVLRASIVDTH